MCAAPRPSSNLPPSLQIKDMLGAEPDESQLGQQSGRNEGEDSPTTAAIEHVQVESPGFRSSPRIAAGGASHGNMVPGQPPTSEPPLSLP